MNKTYKIKATTKNGVDVFLYYHTIEEARKQNPHLYDLEFL